MVINKRLLNRAVKAFAMGIHFGRFGVCSPMGYAFYSHVFGKVALEFATVVGQNMGRF